MGIPTKMTIMRRLQRRMTVSLVKRPASAEMGMGFSIIDSGWTRPQVPYPTEYRDLHPVFAFCADVVLARTK